MLKLTHTYITLFPVVALFFDEKEMLEENVTNERVLFEVQNHLCKRRDDLALHREVV